jgi:hypothetical protein
MHLAEDMQVLHYAKLVLLSLSFSVPLSSLLQLAEDMQLLLYAKQILQLLVYVLHEPPTIRQAGCNNPKVRLYLGSHKALLRL